MSTSTYHLRVDLSSDQHHLVVRALYFYYRLLGGHLLYYDMPPVLLAQEGLNRPRLAMALINATELLFHQDSPSDELRHYRYEQREVLSKLEGCVAADSQVSYELTESELRVIAEGVECYSRFIAGHVRVLDLPVRLPRRPSAMLPGALDEVAKYLFPNNPGRRGIGLGLYNDAIQYEIQRSYEFYKSLLAFDNRQRGVSNIHDGPVLHYSDWPLPTLTLETHVPVPR
jgi:hypothetical protein